MINNTAIARKSTLETETLEGMSLVYTTNVSGPLLVTQVRALTKGKSLPALGLTLLRPEIFPSPVCWLLGQCGGPGQMHHMLHVHYGTLTT